MAVQARALVAFVDVADIARSMAFYAGLGFAVVESVVHPGQAGPVWAWLQAGQAKLMVGQASGPVDASQQAVLFYVYVDDIVASHASLCAGGHRPGPVGHRPWMPDGEFRLHDPDGDVLMLAQRRPRG